VTKPRFPCPECGEPGPIVAMRAGGKRTHIVACLKCPYRGREHTTAEAAVQWWDERAEAAARRREQAAERARRRGASLLRHDTRFQAAVTGRYVGFKAISAGSRPCQVMRMPIGGVEHEVNMRAFVDGWLAPQWPELGLLADPESVAHHVLHDAGLGVYEVKGRKATGEWVGKWRRPEPCVGQALAAAA